MMFNQMKIKLALTNLLLLSIFLFIIFFSTYLVMKGGMQKQSEIIMNAIAKEERIIQIPDLPDTPPLLSNYFFVKLNTNGKILEVSSNITISKDDIENFSGDILKKSETTGPFSYKKITLVYLKVSKSYGHILVFLDKSTENVVLKSLILTLILIGAVSLFLLLLISYYLSSKAIVPIRNSWEKQNAFVADASHELRTPLAVMNSNLEIVMENSDESVESQSKWLQNINGELVRMSNLVDDLMFLARADMDEEEMPITPFDLSVALYQSITAFEPFASKKGLHLLSNIQPEMIVSGNEGRIKQLTTILLDNAVKYSPRGGKINLDTKSGETTVEITISDTGEGIPKEYLEKIFERFYKLDKSRSRNNSGSGLGLSIAKCIVKEHKGNILVSSILGKGSTFKVILPKFTG